MLLRELLSKEYKSNSIFFARSTSCPKLWYYDHVGFIIDSGKQLQMSGHKHGDGVYITNSITEDSNFPPQQLKIINLSKPVLVPSVNNVNAENCSTFVGNVLIHNGLNMDSNYLNNIFKNGIS
jgi:hypothetical protein